MGKSAMIIINPTSGKEKAAEFENKIKNAIKKEYPNLVVEHTKGKGDATKFAKSAGEKGFDLVVSLGGDGTVNETVNGLAVFEEPPVLGIIPMGTVNDLARALNIPINPDKAIEILTKGFHKKIDIGLANDRYFTNILGFGKAAKAIHDVDIEEKSKIGALAYVKAVAKEILEDDIFSVKLEMDNEIWEGEVAVIIIALIDSLGGLRTVLSDAELGDGNFHIFAVKRLNISKIMNMAPSLILGKTSNSDNVKYFKSKTIKIKTPGKDKQETDVDGEKGPNLPLELKVLERHLTVISMRED